jgi:hypothetical protein
VNVSAVVWLTLIEFVGAVPPLFGRFTDTVSVVFTPARVTVTGHEPVCALVGTPEDASPTETVLPETLVVSHDGIPEPLERVTVPVAVPPTLAVALEPEPLLADMLTEVGETLTVGVGVVCAAVTVKLTLKLMFGAFAASTVTVAVYVPAVSEPAGRISKFRLAVPEVMAANSKLPLTHALLSVLPPVRSLKLDALVPERRTVIAPGVPSTRFTRLV